MMRYDTNDVLVEAVAASGPPLSSNPASARDGVPRGQGGQEEQIRNIRDDRIVDNCGGLLIR